jgi:hypothetical protein
MLCEIGLTQVYARAAPEPKPSARRLKEALEEPFWHTVDIFFAEKLWNALGRPSGVPLTDRS